MGPCPGQTLTKCSTRDSEGHRSLLRGKPLKVDELDCHPFDLGQLLTAPDQSGGSALGVDPLSELLDLVLVKGPVAAQSSGCISAVGRLLAVVRVHVGGNTEQPGPVRTPTGVEPGEAARRPDKGLRREVRYRLRVAAPAREVPDQGVYIAQVDLLELLKQRARRLPVRPRP